MRITLRQARDKLLSGDVIAVPTETVYGLAAILDSESAVQKIFTLKKRPQDNPLIVHIGSRGQLRKLVRRVPKKFSKIEKFWPGPLTVVFTANTAAISSVVRAGLATVAVRMPSHPVMRELLKMTGPLVAPSANLSGKPSATAPRHVEADFGKKFPVLDGGPCANGVESTIIAFSGRGWEILRTGAIAATELETALGSKPRPLKKTTRPRSPGQKYRHYAPRATLTPCHSRATLCERAKKNRYAAVLGFDDTRSRLPLVSLGGRNHFDENLRRLYAALRKLDEKNFPTVLVDVDFKRSGLGLTLADRMEKAAQPTQDRILHQKKPPREGGGKKRRADRRKY